MKKKQSFLITFCLFMLLGFSNNISAQTTCKVIGEISIEAVKRGAFVACTRSANPTACSIAFAADACGDDPACSDVVKTITENGCTWTVKVVGKKLRIYGKASISKLNEMKRTYNALNTVQGIRWLQNSLSR